MKNLLRYVTSALLPILLFAFLMPLDAATVKRPLTLKQYADQYYLEWSGSAPTVTADLTIFYMDTTAANLYAVDPQYLLFTDKRSTPGTSPNPWRTFPKGSPPDSACVALTVAGDGDATTSDVYMSQAATKTGTPRKTGTPTAKTHVSTASTTDIQLLKLAFDPTMFWTLTVDPTTATDSIEILRVRVYPCGN